MDNPSRPIPDRIVNLHQSHVRPSVREKAGHSVEFGQKLGFSVADGYTFIDAQSFDNFSEGVTSIASAEKYKARFGYYPERILADTIYRNREPGASARSMESGSQGRGWGDPRPT